MPSIKGFKSDACCHVFYSILFLHWMPFALQLRHCLNLRRGLCAAARISFVSGGVEVSGPERAWKTKSRLCWQSVRMGDAHHFVEAVSFLMVCMPLTEMYTHRAVSAMASWWSHGVALHSCFASLVAFWLCQSDAPHTREKVLNQRTAAVRRPPNNWSEASWKLWLDWDFCLSAFCPFHLQQGHCGPPADVRSVFIWMSIDLGAMPREGSL